MLKELEDYSWFPSTFRNYQTEFIGFVVVKFNVYSGFVNYLQTLPRTVKSMTDLCSGSGEPAISIFRKCNCFSCLSLSDKYPNTLKMHDQHILYEKASVDVMEMDFKQGTYYTMFNAVHHFSDADKVKIIQRIQKTGAEAFIVEVLEPTIVCLIKVMLTTTIGILLLTPWVPPFSFRRLFFTYLIPVNILSTTYDGVVSVFKSRSVKQFQQLFSGSSGSVRIFRIRNGLSPLIVIHVDPGKCNGS